MMSRRKQLRHQAHRQAYGLECACAAAAAALQQTKDGYDLIVRELPLEQQWELHGHLDMLGKAVLMICDDMVAIHAALRPGCPQPQTSVDELHAELIARLRDMATELDKARRIAR